MEAIDNTEQLNVFGIAIKPGVSRNKVLYSKEELDSFAPTLKTRPILMDHNSYDLSKNIGLVTKSSSNKGIVSYEGWIKNPENVNVIARVNDKRIKEVSIGAIAKKVLYDEDKDIFIVEGLEAMELSLVSCAGVKGTSLKQALKTMEKKKLGEKVKILPVLEDFNSFSENIESDPVTESNKDNPITESNPATESDSDNKVVEDVVENNNDQVTEDNSNNKTNTQEVNENMSDDKTLREEVRKEVEAEHAAKLALEKSKVDAEEAMRTKITEEVTAKVLAELKANESAPVVEAPKEAPKVDETKEEMEARIREEVTAKVKEDLRPKTKGKVSTSVSEETKEEAVGEAGKYEMEAAQFGEGKSLFQHPNVDGSYN